MVAKKEIEKVDEKALATTESFLRDNAGIGMEEVSDKDIRTPTLSLIARNANITDNFGNLLCDEHAGEFWYTGTKTVHKTVKCTILAFTKRDLPSFNDKNKLEENYIAMGVFEGEDKLPFKYYFRSSAISAIKNVITEAKFARFPLWAFVVEMSSEKLQTVKDGKTFIYYGLRIAVKDRISDMNELVILKELAERAKNVFASQEVVEDAETAVQVTSEKGPTGMDEFPDVAHPTDEELKETNKQDVPPDDIPF